MQKIKFTSKKYRHNWVEETEDGELIEHPLFLIEEKEVTGNIIKETSKNYVIELEDGNVIKKKKDQVELI